MFAEMQAIVARPVKVLFDAIDLRDLFVFAGLALVAYGGNVLYPGAGWTAAGAGLFWLGARHA